MGTRQFLPYAQTYFNRSYPSGPISSGSSESDACTGSGLGKLRIVPGTAGRRVVEVLLGDVITLRGAGAGAALRVETVEAVVPEERTGSRELFTTVSAGAV